MTARERASQLVKHWRRNGYDPFTDSDILVEDTEAALIAHGQTVREEAVRILSEYLAAYPEDIFIEPPAGEHGQTVDACSARALRAVLPNIIRDVDRIRVE